MADSIKKIHDNDLEKVTGGAGFKEPEGYHPFVIGKKVYHYCPYCCEDHYIMTKSQFYMPNEDICGWHMNCPVIGKDFEIRIEDDMYTYRNQVGLPLRELEMKKYNPTMYGDF